MDKKRGLEKCCNWCWWFSLPVLLCWRWNSEGILAVDLTEKMIYCNAPMGKIYPHIKECSSEIIRTLQECIKAQDVLRIDDLIYEPKCQPLYHKKRLKGIFPLSSDCNIIRRWFGKYERNLLPGRNKRFHGKTDAVCQIEEYIAEMASKGNYN